MTLMDSILSAILCKPSRLVFPCQIQQYHVAIHFDSTDLIDYNPHNCQGKFVFMKKSVQKIFRFFPQGKKKRIVISLVSVLAAGLVVLLIVLPIGKLQLLHPKATPSSIDGGVGIGSQQ